RAGAGSVRRSGVLEGRRSRVSRELGGALPDQPASDLPAAVERTLADDQPGALADPGSWRTRLSRSQAAVGLRQSEIPRLGQEPGAGADHVCTGQPLPASPATAPSRGQVCAVRKLRAASFSALAIAEPTTTRTPFSEPDRHDYFSQSLPHNDLCRASLAPWRARVFRDRTSWAIALYFVFLLAVFYSITRVIMLPDGQLQTCSPHVTSGDEPHYLLVLNSILFDHDLELQDDYRRAEHGPDAGGVPLPDHHTIIVNRRTGEHGIWFEHRQDRGLLPGPDVYEVSSHPVAFPAMLALLIAPFHPTMNDVQRDASLVIVLICWLGAIFTYLLSRRAGMGRGLALLATALLALASPWLAYARAFFAEPAIGLAAVIALWALEADRPFTSALAAAAAAFF